MTNTEYLSWLCLKTSPDLGPKMAIELLKHYPDPTEFAGHPDHPLFQSGMLSKNAAEHLKKLVLPNNVDVIRNMIDKYQIECLNIHQYPVRLKDIFAPPLLLYIRGNKDCLFKPVNLAVVGTRKAGTYGKAMCAKLLAPLCRQRVNIISGLALGIDTYAHRTALQEGGSTVAVLAAGLDTVYPPQNVELARQIVANGALISEYEPGCKSEKWNFPARNRIISALSEVVFVVEGPINSGALLTAKNAVQQNREVCALPGNINNINAEGPNHLIKSGASAITCSEDLMLLLGMNPEKAEQTEIATILGKDEQLIYDLLKSRQESLGFDEILLLSKLPIGRLSTLITNLELKGLIDKEGGNSFFAL